MTRGWIPAQKSYILCVPKKFRLILLLTMLQTTRTLHPGTKDRASNWHGDCYRKQPMRSWPLMGASAGRAGRRRGPSTKRWSPTPVESSKHPIIFRIDQSDHSAFSPLSLKVHTEVGQSSAARCISSIHTCVCMC